MAPSRCHHNGAVKNLATDPRSKELMLNISLGKRSDNGNRNGRKGETRRTEEE